MPRTDVDIDPVIPDDLADALRRAAAAVPPADLHPTHPVLRLRTRRRRRYVAAAGSLAAALTAVVAVNLVGSDEGEGPPIATDASDNTPAQFEITPLRLPGRASELLPDGTERPLPKAQPNDIIQNHVRFADGRLVILAIRPVEAEEEPPDDGLVETASAAELLGDMGPTFLSVFDADGALLAEQEVTKPDARAQLIGDVDGQAVVLYMGADEAMATETFAIDLDTFEQTRLGSDDGPQQRGTAAGGRLVIAQEQGAAVNGGPIDQRECWVDVSDLPDGAPRRVDLPGCVMLWDVALSPDGRHLAFIGDRAHASIEGDGQTTLQIIDLASGDIVAATPVPNPCSEGTCSLLTAQAITWTGTASVTAVVDNTASHGTEPPFNEVMDRHILTAEVP